MSILYSTAFFKSEIHTIFFMFLNIKANMMSEQKWSTINIMINVYKYMKYYVQIFNSFHGNGFTKFQMKLNIFHKDYKIYFLNLNIIIEKKIIFVWKFDSSMLFISKKHKYYKCRYIAAGTNSTRKRRRMF